MDLIQAQNRSVMYRAELHCISFSIYKEKDS